MRDDTLARVAVLIPAYNPDDTLRQIVESLVGRGFGTVIVVNDGSQRSEIFSRINQYEQVTVLTFLENRGKGAALKRGMAHLVHDTEATVDSIITMDADGQHTVADVEAIGSLAQTRPDALYMGVRDFSDDVPLRSKFGNQLSRVVLRITTGINLQDTQTGLRVIPAALAAKFLAIQADRYDFELECLLVAKTTGTTIEQTPISTIYMGIIHLTF